MATSMLSTATVASINRASPAQASMVAPFTGLKSTSAFPNSTSQFVPEKERGTDMAAAVLSSCLALPTKLKNLSLNSSCSTASSSSSTCPTFGSLSFSSALSHNVFNKGCLSMSIVRRPIGHSIVCEAAPKKKADSAEKRARQAEKRRIYNKARKSEIRTRMKKVLEALDDLRKRPDAQAEEVLTIEKLIAEAYSVIDKAVKVGTLHRNTGARRKSRLARRKKAVEIHHGWYTPAPAGVTAN